MPTPSDLYIGLMSGTSLDGIDAALVEFIHDYPRLISTHYQPYPDPLRTRIAQLCQPELGDIEQLGVMDIELGRQFATAVQELITRAGITPDAVRAIGSHGQTVRHHPQGTHPFTIQIGDPNLLAELSGITTVADFRRRDLAAGGEGAPLVPAFHQAVFRTDHPRVVVNIGGIANLTWLPYPLPEPVAGFDTGPGNTLMDSWVRRHLSLPHDAEGGWASQGKIHAGLLERLLADQYFSRSPPKSTGRETFNLAWLDAALGAFHARPIAAVDVQATLGELTAVSIARAVLTFCPAVREVLVCGGGGTIGI